MSPLHPTLADDDDDPLLSAVNLVDVLLVVLAGVLLAAGHNPVSALQGERVTVIRHAGTPQMEVLIKDGARLERFTAGEAGAQGAGVKAGTAYRLPDGSMVFVPEPPASAGR